MIHDLNLPLIGSGEGLHIIWDSDKGTVTGPNAPHVMSYLAYALEEGGVISHPYPTGYNISDPLHNMVEMAALLSSMRLLIPLEFADAMRSVAPPIEDFVSDIEPIH